MLKNLKEYGMLINPMQVMRIKEGNTLEYLGMCVIDDNLEMGVLRVYDPMEGSIIIQTLVDPRMNKGLFMCCEIIVNNLWTTQEILPFGNGKQIIGDEKLWIHSVKVEYGYEEIIPSLIRHVIDFARFYGYEQISMSKKTHEKLSSIDEDIVNGFEDDGNGVYECQLN